MIDSEQGHEETLEKLANGNSLVKWLFKQCACFIPLTDCTGGQVLARVRTKYPLVVGGVELAHQVSPGTPVVIFLSIPTHSCVASHIHTVTNIPYTPW